MYFPIWWLFGLLHVALVFRLTTDMQVVTVLFGALGVLCLARARSLAWRWALVAAAAYLFFGGFYGESEHTPYIYGFADLPWLLWSLTPPRNPTARWTRLIALPLIGWLIVSGAYPADAVSFAIVGAVYLAVALFQANRDALMRYRLPLLLAVASTAAVAVAVLLPYETAVHAHQLWRPSPPTAAVRAGESIKPVDLFGLYLSPFAWNGDGTVDVLGDRGSGDHRAVPASRPLATPPWPLTAMGVVALVLAMTPRIGPIGRLMAGPLSPLFPSRFPAADYKPAVAIAAVILAAEAWSAVAARATPKLWTAVVGGVALLIGALVAPSTYASPTRTFWLLAIVVVATVALALRRPRACDRRLRAARPRSGRRLAQRARRHAGRSHLVLAGDPDRGDRIGHAPARCIHPAAARVTGGEPGKPAGTGSAGGPLAEFPSGTNNDSDGWIADGYHLIDYGGTVEAVAARGGAEPDLDEADARAVARLHVPVRDGRVP